MPRAKGPGRPRKFEMGQLAVEGLTAEHPGDWVTVVDYKANPKDSYYRVIRSVPLRKPRWISSTRLTPVDRKSIDTLRIYRSNERLEERGCTCNCCVHQAVPRRFWRVDIDE